MKWWLAFHCRLLFGMLRSGQVLDEPKHEPTVDIRSG